MGSLRWFGTGARSSIFVAVASVIAFVPLLGASAMTASAVPVPAGTFRSAVLTPSGNSTIALTSVGDNLFLQAPTTATGGNFREVIWSTSSVATLNQQSCATWVGESTSSVQEGLAVRIATSGTTTRAITVTKNVVYDVHWVFNAHVWNTSSASPLTAIGQFDMSQVAKNEIGHTRFMPWSVCLRAVGTTLTFKLWFPTIMAEPSWSDPAYTRSAAIPAAYAIPGRAGWYVGHAVKGQYTQYTELTTESL